MQTPMGCTERYRIRQPITVHFAILAIFVSTLGPPRTLSAGAFEMISVKKIWSESKHNAFTDLIRFQNKWFCTFREAESHLSGHGKIRVLSSVEGEQWDSLSLLAEPGVDLRDPKLSITPDDRLMLLVG